MSGGIKQQQMKPSAAVEDKEMLWRPSQTSWRYQQITHDVIWEIQELYNSECSKWPIRHDSISYEQLWHYSAPFIHNDEIFKWGAWQDDVLKVVVVGWVADHPLGGYAATDVILCKTEGGVALMRLLEDFVEWAKLRDCEFVEIGQETGYKPEVLQRIGERLGFAYGGVVMVRALRHG